jgi:hypothetical protein
VNHAKIHAALVANNAADTSSAWADKTADEILTDINTAIIDCWNAAENDGSAMPNHIIMPYAQYNYIATTKVTPLADKTILKYVLENNISANSGTELMIGGTNYCKGAGTGGTDRMVVYVHNDRFIAVEELVPLSRVMTSPNDEFCLVHAKFCDALAYDSAYMANVSEVEFFYTQTVLYADGI